MGRQVLREGDAPVPFIGGRPTAPPPTSPALPRFFLPQRLVQDDSDGRGEVEAAHSLAGDRDREDAAGMARQKLIRKDMGFAGEQENIAAPVANGRVAVAGPGAEAEETFSGQHRLELLNRGVPVQFHGVPVIDAGTAQRAVVEAKTEPADQAHRRTRRRAKPGAVARIPWYLRFP